MNQLQKTSDNLPKEFAAHIKNIEEFVKILNEAPAKTDVRVNELISKKPLYLPISFVQMKLDEIFFGLWNWEIKSIHVVANELCGYGVLEFYHPIANVWIRRTGSAATMIQYKSVDNGGDGMITNINNKITNTLVKDYPHLEAEMLKSAAKKIGPAFGRDLNRKHTDSYIPMSDKLAVDELKLKIRGILDDDTKSEKIPAEICASINKAFELMDDAQIRRAWDAIYPYVKEVMND